MNVLVYNGPGTTPGSVKHTTETLRDFLEPFYVVSTVSARALQIEPWTSKAAAVVFPGGADLPYVKECKPIITKLKDFVRKQGGIYIGFCAGGYFGSGRVEFAKGNPDLEVSGNRDLKFFPGIARGPAFDGFQYNSEVGAKAATLSLPDGSAFASYYNGGSVFVDADEFDGVEVLARYSEPTDVGYWDGSSKTKELGPAAVLLCSIGKGKALLTGPHPEFLPRILERTDNKSFLENIVSILKADDKKRLNFLRTIFTKAGLNCNNDFARVRSPSLTPLIVCASPTKQNVLAEFEKNCSNIQLTLGGSETYAEINGGKDKFRVYQGFSHSYSEAENSLRDQEPDEVTKSIIFPGKTETLPPLTITANYDVSKYFRYLNPGNTVGSLMFYGEVLTSTSSLLNDNSYLLSSIPESSMLHVGTIQVSGHGRGGNTWVNPKGVSASTAVISLPTFSPRTKQRTSVVFMQYVSMLAYCKAITNYGPGYSDLPVRIKWPNDLYALSPQYYHRKKISLVARNLDHTVVPLTDIEPAYMKIAGLLVNTHFVNEKYLLLLGCGLNVSHDGPTTSLNSWIEILNKERQAARLDLLEPFEVERLHACYMNHLEILLKKFIDFGPTSILPEYYKLWLHSSQIVTLTDHNGVQAMITGITDDYGLLIARELMPGSTSHFTGSVYHLQPDGNTFDIFRGLISKKAL